MRASCGERTRSRDDHTLSSDTLSLLALLLPFLIVCIGFKHRALFTVSFQNHRSQPRFSAQRAYTSFSSYALLSQQELDAKRASYATLNRVNKRLAQKIGYGRKLDTLKELISLNATVAEGIGELIKEDESRNTRSAAVRTADTGGLSRVREAFKHFIRDWSIEGRSERAQIFEPIINVLKGVPLDKRRDTKVLVPGCGLGRLAWEVSELGFETTANDLSPYMLSCLRFLLSPKHTHKVNHHTLRPYAHWFSHQRTNSSLFRPIHFPDILPRACPTFNVLQGDFMFLSPPQEGYDYIITLFFIDTSLDVISTLRKIHTLLRPEGIWINLGPLLWTSGSQAKVELSLEEVELVAEEIGFRFVPVDDVDEGMQNQHLKRRMVECEYTADKEAMMRWIYQAEFWVARKS